MSSPFSEKHRRSSWLLTGKKKRAGTSLNGQPAVTNVATFKCQHCNNIYTRIVTDKEYEDLEIGFSNWSWDWVRI